MFGYGAYLIEALRQQAVRHTVHLQREGTGNMRRVRLGEKSEKNFVVGSSADCGSEHAEDVAMVEKLDDQRGRRYINGKRAQAVRCAESTGVMLIVYCVLS